MVRTVKAPEERRNELLDCAQSLFFARGYDDTSVNDVIAAAGVSKGAFYHYFDSKEALLEAFAERLAERTLAQLEPIIGDPELGAVDRLNAFLAGSRRIKAAAAPQLRSTFFVLYRPENIVLFYRIHRAVAAVTAPALARIIAAGVAEGVFDTPDPLATAEMLIQINAGMHAVMSRALAQAERGEVEAASALLDHRLRLYGIAADRLLKLPDGTLRFAEPGFARAILGR